MEFKNLKTRTMSYGLALALAAAPAPAIAAVHTFGTVYEEQFEMTYNTYKVEENDNASKISTRVVNYFIKKGEVPKSDLENYKNNPNSTCRYWPAIANLNLNKYNKFRIHPGDTIKFPETYDELIEANIVAKQQPWYKQYCAQEHYASYVYIDKEEAIKRIKEVNRAMNKNVKITDAYVEAYLKLIGGDNTKYILKDGASLFGDEVWQFFDYCPTPEEVNKEINKENTKQKKR